MKIATSAEKRVSYLLSANDNRRVVSKKRCFQVQTKSKEVTMTNQKTSAKSNEPMMTPPPLPPSTNVFVHRILRLPVVRHYVRKAMCWTR